MSNVSKAMDIHQFHNTPPWVSIGQRMCLIKTLLGKTLWDKNLVKEK